MGVGLARKGDRSGPEANVSCRPALAASSQPKGDCKHGSGQSLWRLSFRGPLSSSSFDRIARQLLGRACPRWLRSIAVRRSRLCLARPTTTGWQALTLELTCPASQPEVRWYGCRCQTPSSADWRATGSSSSRHSAHRNVPWQCAGIGPRTLPHA